MEIFSDEYEDIERDENYCSDQGGLKVGTILDDNYKIIKTIKAGVMGTVYKAYDNGLDEICAVKEIFQKEENDCSSIKECFIKEAKLLTDLKHNGIPGVTDYFNKQNRYYLVMDYLDGVDLFSYMANIRGGTGLDEKTVIKWAVEVCNILIYLHNQKPQPIIHKGIKPSHIILCNDGKIMLIDFGLTKPMASRSPYVAMEQQEGHPEARSDLYSLAGIMHFLLTGIESTPFNFEPLKDVRLDISDWLDAFIKKALSLYPANRFSSALEMKEILEEKITTEIYKSEEIDYRKEAVKLQTRLPLPVSGGKKDFLNQKREVKPLPEKISLFDLSNPSDIEKIIDMAENEDIKALEPLIRMLEEEDFREKHIKIIELLGNFRDERVIEPLVKALSDPDEAVRRYAPMSLAKTGDKRVVTELGKLLNDPVLAVRKSTLKAIGDLTDKNTMNFLALFLTRDKKDFMDKFPEDENLYFNTLEELIINICEKKEPLKCYTHLAVLYEADVKYFEAEKNIKKALAIKKDDINLLLIYVRILIWLKKYEEAEENIKKILEVKDDINLQLDYADIIANLNKYPQAIEIYNDIYITYQRDDLEDNLIKLYYNYGKELEKIGNIEGALEEYHNAYLVNPAYKEKKFFEALITLKTEKSKKGIKLMEKYLEENPMGHWYDEASEIARDFNPFNLPRGAPGLRNFLY